MNVMEERQNLVSFLALRFSCVILREVIQLLQGSSFLSGNWNN